ncbi:MAG: hypothetical protein ACYDCL_00360 [Myxococcales bacterium]
MIRSIAAAVCLCLSAAAHASAASGGYSLQLVDARGRRLPTFLQGGHTYVMGTAGQRYALRLRNRTDGRVEMVAAVDGRDVVDGRPSTLRQRGYVLGPHSEVRIEGFRLGEDQVAAFRFGSVSDSYAVRMGGAADDVGQIAVAVFQEQELPAAVAEMAPASSVAAQPVRTAAVGPPPMPSPAADGSGRTGQAPASERARPRAHALRAAPRQLGTTFGEERRSHVDEEGFRRSGHRPTTYLSLRYESRESLEALGIDVEARLAASRLARRRQAAQPVRRDEPVLEEAPGVLAR